MLTTSLRALLALIKKDLGIWIRQPATVIATVLPPLAFLLVEFMGAAAVGRSPVALVQMDHGAKANQMAQIFYQADVFRLTSANSEAQAQALLKNLSVVAVITIPPNFTQQVEQKQPAQINVEVNNLNLDFTNDIRRSVPDAITQFYQVQGSSSPVKVTMQEHDLRARDVELFQYDVLPTIVLLLMISGLVSSGISTSREWDSRTVKELLLSPVSSSILIGGKVLAGFLTTFALGLLVLLLGYTLGWTQPQGWYWLSTLLIMALVALFSSSLGVAIGALLQRVQPVIAISINVAIYLFFLAGGIGVLAFEPQWLQFIAAYIPLSYGDHALQMAIFYNSTDQLGRDALVLACSALVSLGLGVLAMRRSIAS
ncbi:MAG TPA: ABC transporter permease [Ktedonobacteraceae bacterium]|jgi:ABC-type multidrug transport system permease subunit